MPIAPPMNDQITVKSIVLDENGNPELDRWGKEKRDTRSTKARVKYSGEVVFTRNGTETTATLDIRLPHDFRIKEGDGIEWVDQFGVTVSTTVEKLQDVKDYPGNVQYRKVWTV